MDSLYILSHVFTRGSTRRIKQFDPDYPGPDDPGKIRLLALGSEQQRCCSLHRSCPHTERGDFRSPVFRAGYRDTVDIIHKKLLSGDPSYYARRLDVSSKQKTPIDDAITYGTGGRIQNNIISR